MNRTKRPSYKITVLESCSLEMRKHLIFSNTSPFQSIPFQNPANFNAYANEVKNIQDLKNLLLRLQGQPKHAIIRGRRVEGTYSHRIPRLQHDKIDKATGKVIQKATFRHQDTPWMMIDLDDLRTPFPVNPASKEDLQKAALFARSAVAGGIFEGVACVVKFSSHAFLDKKTGQVDNTLLKCHLYFWLDKKVCDESLKEVCKSLGIKDLSVYNPVQIHYTANPKITGATDHLVTRLLFLEGDAEMPTQKMAEAASVPLLNLQEYAALQEQQKAQKEAARLQRKQAQEERLKAQVSWMKLCVVMTRHPELKNLICNHFGLEMGDETFFDVQDGFEELYALNEGVRVELARQGYRPDQPLETMVGKLCLELGIKRGHKRVRVGKKQFKTEYWIDLDQTVEAFYFGKNEYKRLMERIASHKTVEEDVCVEELAQQFQTSWLDRKSQANNDLGDFFS